MRTVRRWVLILAMAGPAILNLSCSGVFWQELKTAAISGAASFVEQAVFDVLDQTISPDDNVE